MVEKVIGKRKVRRRVKNPFTARRDWFFSTQWEKSPINRFLCVSFSVSLNENCNHVDFLTFTNCPFFSGARLCWLNVLTIAPGIRAARAIPNSVSNVPQENISSRDLIFDKMDPVWTQMKLYGSRPVQCRKQRWFRTIKSVKRNNCDYIIYYHHIPIRTEKKNWPTGMFKMGEDKFRNQLGVMGNKRKKRRKKKRLLRFSSIWKTVNNIERIKHHLHILNMVK